MAAQPLSLLRWHAIHVWRRVGWQMAVALVALLIAVLLVWQTERMNKDLARLRSDLKRAEAKPVSLASAADPPAMQQQLAEFYGRLPDQGDVPGVIRKLFTVADKHEVKLAKGDYRASTDTAARLIRYQILLPVSGDAGRIQDFMLDALAEVPSLGLEGISFKRESTLSGNVESRLRLVLLVSEP